MDTNSINDLNSRMILRFFKSRRFWKAFIGIIMGGTGGYIYFYFVGCKSGTCPITSNPFGSILMGGLLGFLISGMFDRN